MFLRINLVLICLSITSFSLLYGQRKVSADNFIVEKKSHVIRQVGIPVVLIGLGIWGTTDNNFINHDEIREERFEFFPGFTNKADNYLQFAPIVLTYSLDILGLDSKNSLQRKTVLLAGSQLFMFSMVYPLKHFTHILRPDSSAANSFPSGHTAQAFLAATFFTKEYGKKYPWVSVGMYTLSTGIGVMRILNNKHWISDVLAGAGIGMLSVELSYLFDKIYRKKIVRAPVSIMPIYQQEHFGFTMKVGI